MVESNHLAMPPGEVKPPSAKTPLWLVPFWPKEPKEALPNLVPEEELSAKVPVDAAAVLALLAALSLAEAGCVVVVVLSEVVSAVVLPSAVLVLSVALLTVAVLVV